MRPADFVTLIFFLFICAVTFFVTGCATTGASSVASVTSTINRYDLFGTVNGTTFEGIGVIPPAKSYVFRIESREDIDLFTITSCHREFAAESVIEQGWFKKNRGYEYTYTPAPGIEDSRSCLVRIGSYNKSVENQNSHAIIDFITPTETLPATNICNGAMGGTGGVSMCQSKVGLVERLKFAVLTSALAPASAPDSFAHKDKICSGSWVDAYTWEYHVGEGECVIAFMETAKPNRFHRHTVVGYTRVLIRGN